MHSVTSSPWTVRAFRQHERHLWGIAYRMTGSSSDADDVVQETFARALEHPPARLDAPLRPWLTRVAVNAARDALRRRKRRRYVGPWLPAPVESEDLEDVAGELHVTDSGGAEARYDLRESASYAFLVALEALSPQQRAVLLLRDVLDYSVREAADALALSESNVKTTHHRAREAMRAYDQVRRPPTPALRDETRDALQRFLVALVSGDTPALETFLAEGARAVSDGGGEYLAALRPILGRDRVVRFLTGLQRKARWSGRVALANLNGLPAIVADIDDPGARWAPRLVLRCELDERGIIREVHIIVASEKLAAVRARQS
jgi:RNA polymerase sigma-70 factor (ECF subfamily)